MAVVFPNVLVLHPSVPANTLAEFVALAKAKPGTINYGSSGVGNAGHLAGELFRIVAKVDIVHVPYKGGGPATTDLLGGQIAAVFATPASVVGHIKTGRLRALATTGAQRSLAMPEVPTIAESARDLGLGDFDIHTWFGLFAPARLPAEVTVRLNRAFVDALNSAELKARLATLMAEPAPSTPEAFAQFVRAENAKYEAVVKRTGAKAD
jgi:tripartite-type tricarboxylate transporter receptor subunit TctC